MIEQERLPSGPMEQRWSASSSSPMSPAYSQNKDEIFSWVGIIQFIPVEELRDPIEKSFVGFAKKFIDIGYDFGALIHWGKVDLAFHDTPELLNEMRRALWDRCDVERYQKARALLDPKNIMSNELMTALFPHPKDESIAPPNNKSRRIVRHYTLFFKSYFNVIHKTDFAFCFHPSNSMVVWFYHFPSKNRSAAGAPPRYERSLPY